VHRARWIQNDYIQATTSSTSDTTGPINISAVYCPPKFNNTKDQYLDFLKSLGNWYFAGGDYNAKLTTLANLELPYLEIIKILKELPDAIITYIRNLFNGILRLQYFPITWKVGHIKAIPNTATASSANVIKNAQNNHKSRMVY